MTPPNFRRTLAEEELDIGQSIKCSLNWAHFGVQIEE